MSLSLATGVRLAVLASVALAGCDRWKDKVTPVEPPPPPEQFTTQEPPFEQTIHGVTAKFEPKARYRLNAFALIRDTSMRDPWSDVANLDIAFVWGELASNEILKKLSFHLRRRYVSIRWGGDFAMTGAQVMKHISNHHLIPANPEVEDALFDIRRGDKVSLEGMLVNITVDGKTMRSSLTRDDIGSGACEVVYVESVRSGPDAF